MSPLRCRRLFSTSQHGAGGEAPLTHAAPPGGRHPPAPLQARPKNAAPSLRLGCPACARRQGREALAPSPQQAAHPVQQAAPAEFQVASASSCGQPACRERELTLAMLLQWAAAALLSVHRYQAVGSIKPAASCRNTMTWRHGKGGTGGVGTPGSSSATTACATSPTSRTASCTCRRDSHCQEHADPQNDQAGLIIDCKMHSFSRAQPTMQHEAKHKCYVGMAHENLPAVGALRRSCRRLRCPSVSRPRPAKRSRSATERHTGVVAR